MELQLREMCYQMCVVYVGEIELSISSLMFTDISLADSNSVTIYILILYTFDR